MPTRVFSCAVACWFADGEGWAFDRRLENQERDVVAALGDDIRTPLYEHPEGFAILRRGPRGWLVGHKVPDRHSRDPQAAHRSPSMLRVALVPGEERPSAEMVTAIGEQLSSVRPDDRGLCDLSIRVRLPDPLVLAPAPQSGRHRLAGCWKQLAEVWQSAIEAGEFTDSFVSPQFVAQKPDGRTITQAETLRGDRKLTGFVREAQPLLLESENALFAIGSAGKDECVIQVFEALDGVIKILLHRHLRLDGRANSRGGSPSLLGRLFGGGERERDRDRATPSDELQEVVKYLWSCYATMSQDGWRMIHQGETGSRTVTDRWLLQLAWLAPFRPSSR